ncbi:hypothetical protein L6452_10531 [Arctium lappa]|uniref:Uncharacterized protein n=1 Tax=Arctium lappa TaxID=4217 RepID=A0ACB9DMY3_ARCLA|nr:hypothetical protein L6452_10531 [Arctium lappa]
MAVSTPNPHFQMRSPEKQRWHKTLAGGSTVSIQKIKCGCVKKFDGNGNHSYYYNESDNGNGRESSSNMFVNTMREAQPYFGAHRGAIFVVVVSAKLIDGPNFDAILKR